MDLNQIRQQINEIDEQIVNLITKRMACSIDVANYKVNNGLPVLNSAREQEVLEKVSSKSPDLRNEMYALYSAIMDISKAQQYPIVYQNCEQKEKIFNGFRDRVGEIEKVICAGMDGAYSSMAAKKLFPNAQLSYTEDFSDIFDRVKSGEFDRGIIPVENSFAGSVVENYDHLIDFDMYITDAITIPVNHCLMGLAGARDKIKCVYSHEQALAQCAEFIDNHGYTPSLYKNTALAAKFVAESGDDTMAAIASERAAQINGLEIFERNIQSSDENSTRFVAISNKLTIGHDADVISIAFSLPHDTAGALFCVLSRLAAMGLNMTKIESRPLKSSPFEYMFYMDFIGNVKDEKTWGLICGLSDELPEFKFIGNYRIK